jgi:hypothetical protein
MYLAAGACPDQLQVYLRWVMLKSCHFPLAATKTQGKCGSVVEHLGDVHEALGSILSTTEKQKLEAKPSAVVHTCKSIFVRLRQEDLEFEAIYTVRLSQKTRKKKPKKLQKQNKKT